MQGPWSQYKALSMHCDELPCFFDEPGRDENSTDFIYGQYNEVRACNWAASPSVPQLVAAAQGLPEPAHMISPLLSKGL